MTERTLIITVFAVLLGIALTLTLIAHLRRDTLAPLGTVIALSLRTRTARLIMLPVWVWLGWHFLAR